jgi:hypothetical protein
MVIRLDAENHCKKFKIIRHGKSSDDNRRGFKLGKTNTSLNCYGNQEYR